MSLIPIDTHLWVVLKDMKHLLFIVLQLQRHRLECFTCHIGGRRALFLLILHGKYKIISSYIPYICITGALIYGSWLGVVAEPSW